MAEQQGNNESGATQEATSQSTDTQKAATEQSAAQGSNEQKQESVTLAEHNKVRGSLTDVLKKKDAYKGQAEALQKKIDVMEKAAADGATDPDDQRKKYEEIIEGKEKTIKGMKLAARRKEIDSQVTSSAAQLKAVNVKQVLRIITPDIIFDEANNACIDDGNGEPKINTVTGKRVTVAEAVAQLLAENTNLVQSSGNSGAGGAGGGSGAKTSYSREDINNMSDAEYKKNISNICKAKGIQTS